MQNPDDLARHERESVDRQLREPYPAGTPHHSSVNSLPLHQPVASRLAGAIHSPGGLLANHGSSGSSVPLGGPPGPSNTFGPPLHEANRGPPPAVGQGPPQSGGQGQHQMFAPLGHHPMPPSAPLGPTAGPPPSSVFGGPLQPDNARPPPLQQMQYGGNSVGPGAGGPPPPPMQGGNAIAPGPGPGPGPSSGQGGIAQGQQPILNVSCLAGIRLEKMDLRIPGNIVIDMLLTRYFRTL